MNPAALQRRGYSVAALRALADKRKLFRDNAIKAYRLGA